MFLFLVPKEIEPAPKPDSTTGDLPPQKTPLISFVPEGKKKPEPAPASEPDISGSSDASDMPGPVQMNQSGIVRRVFKDSNWKAKNNIVGGLICLKR